MSEDVQAMALWGRVATAREQVALINIVDVAVREERPGVRAPMVRAAVLMVQALTSEHDPYGDASVRIVDTAVREARLRRGVPGVRS